MIVGYLVAEDLKFSERTAHAAAVGPSIVALE